MEYLTFVLLGSLTIGVGTAQAETAYVKCSPGTYSLPVFSSLNYGVGGRLVANLSCGEAVNVIEQDSDWAKIRLRNGKSAYASSLFLTTAPTQNVASAASEPAAAVGADNCHAGTHRISTSYGSFCGTGQSDAPTQTSPSPMAS